MKLEENMLIQRTLEVDIDFESEKIEATISFGGMNIPMLELKNIGLRELEKYKHSLTDTKYISCQTRESKETITIHNIRTEYKKIIGECISIGEGIKRYNALEIELSELSSWMEGGLIRKSERNEVNWKINEFKNDLKFTWGLGKDTIELLIDSCFEVKKNSNSNYNIEIQRVIIIRNLTSEFELHEIKKITEEIRCFFSLLIGRGINILTLKAYDFEDRRCWQNFIFPSYVYEGSNTTSLEAIVDFNYLTKESNIETLMCNYFNNENFKDIWNRIPPAFTQETIWEYDIFGKVVILEKYITRFIEIKNKDITQSEKRKTKEKVNDFKTKVSQYAEKIKNRLIQCKDEEKKLVGNEIKIVDGMIDAISNFRNSSTPTFRQKYYFLKEHIKEKTWEAIFLKDGEFNIVKKLRDDIAHGNNYDKKTSKKDNLIINDITEMLQLSDKIMVILMYLSYIDMGMEEKDIIRSFMRSHNRFVINSRISYEELEKICNPEIYIPLDKKILNKDELKTINIVLTKSDINEKWRIDEVLTSELQHNCNKSNETEILIFIKSLLNNDSDYEIEFVPKVYLCYEGEEMLFLNCVKIKDYTIM